MQYEIYTDGSCLGNPGPGGWAALIKNLDTGGEEIVRGNEPQTTNNKMELTAIIKAIGEFVPDSNDPPKIKIYSDSAYCVRGISEWLPQWVKINFKGKKNVDLWKTYLKMSDGLDISIEWIKAHNGHPENSLVDSIANEEANKLG